MEPLSIVTILNERHQTSYRVMSKFGNGVQGAYTIQDTAGNAFVLKWSDMPALTARLDEAIRYTTLLERGGYPCPRFLHVGEALGGQYTVQQKLPGLMCTQENLPLYIPQILELNELQRGAAEPGSWPLPIVQAVPLGGTEFCPHEPLLKHSTATAELLTRLQRIASSYERYSYPLSDIVHFDFHHQNLLVHEGRVSGVVDWQTPCAGDAAFDLLTLMLYLLRAGF